MKLWLDDVRPAPEGWTWVKTVDEARARLVAGGVDHLSLDHDLGICPCCTPGTIVEAANIVVVSSTSGVCDVKQCCCACHLTG